MSLRSTNVYADADDLMLIKEAAARRGIPEAEIILDRRDFRAVRPLTPHPAAAASPGIVTAGYESRLAS